MKHTSLVGIVLVATSLLAQNEANPTVCQGEYSASGTDADGRPKVQQIDHWHMDLRRDGSYSVEVDLLTGIEGAKVEERHLLTKAMKPTGFVSVMSSRAGRESQFIKVECDYGSAELSCHTLFNGVSAAAKIPQKMPYVFWPIAEDTMLDFPWVFQAFASQAERVIGHKTAVPVMILDDGEVENGITIRLEEIEQVEYLGLDTIEVLGRKLRAHKFRLSDSKQPDGVEEFWISHSGILLSSRIVDGEDGVAITLTGYQGPPLGQ